MITSCYAKESHSLVIKIYYNKEPKSHQCIHITLIQPNNNNNNNNNNTISNENTIAIKFWYGILLEVIEISVQSGSNHGYVEQQWNSV